MKEKPRSALPSGQPGPVTPSLRPSVRLPAGPQRVRALPPRMRISHFLACGLSLALLSVRLEARPAAQPQRKPPRSAPGHELAESLAAGPERGETAGGGGGRGSGSRLLRELRVDTKSRAAWARLLRDYPGTRRHKGVSKKGLSKGCFGLKLDRIGSMSGLGC
ncbi:C-type natriuretic peptide [Mauremys mutica]|nr:C-type natriuretic peptide [Mauremys mutica]